MKNENMKREYFGYNFIFEDEITRERFLNLYGDLIKDYEIYENNKLCVRILCKGGVIPEIKKGLGKMITTQRYRYYVKRA